MRDDVATSLLRESQHVRDRTVRAIANSDLALLFDLYDDRFFSGRLRRLIDDRGAASLTFRVAPRLTRAGGKTTRVRRPHPKLGKIAPIDEYEISIASSLLFMSFTEADRPTVVAGHRCADRLDALLRIYEHELTHLIELLQTDRSSCSRSPFQLAARHMFGHTAFNHGLVLPEEHAARTHGVRVGQTVRFSANGQTLIGRINRINKRATVLVEHPAGRRYSDGKHYLSWYVPLDDLETT
jgi:hypothetical protein